MTRMTTRPRSPKPPLSLLFSTGIAVLTATNAALAASTADSGENALWDLLIVLVVMAVTVGSAVLPLAAIRQWDRRWKFVAGLPLLLLLLWILIIVISRTLNPESHQLWVLEIFTWAMINMIYMVVAMTAKRLFARKEAETR